MHTTDYFNVFISISEDCPVKSGTVPSAKEKKTIAQIQYELLNNNPYVYSSDDVIYLSVGERKGMSREDFFSKGRACLRSSPLVKSYGWGIHINKEGKVALYSSGADAYMSFQTDGTVKQLKGFRSSKM